MRINKAYKFRLYPNGNQRELINKTFGCTRLVYNYYLNKKTSKQIFKIKNSYAFTEQGIYMLMTVLKGKK